MDALDPSVPEAHARVSKSIMGAHVHPDVCIATYRNEEDLKDVMRLIEKELSEPYHIYTYRYFLHDWPDLSFLAWWDGQAVGVIVCKLDRHMRGSRLMRGYIAMLSVDPRYRGRGIGTCCVLTLHQLPSWSRQLCKG